MNLSEDIQHLNMQFMANYQKKQTLIAWKLHEEGMHMELVDKSIEANEYETGEVKKIMEIALMCTQASASMRPTMSEVVVLLKSKGLFENMQPSMPVFVESNMKVRGDISASTAGEHPTLAVDKT
ncbi:hypothetical protein HN51_000615 [Arachis hypogaea]